ncbi:MAG: type II toxin-antitoxin system HicA family toxin [Defluviitaleaceae bacterium]|nr:type II toxin-antitoxin system HicA family toxin [Defluviitaleaceae bacterium]
MGDKIYGAVLSGQSDNNIKFTDLQRLIIDLGFAFERQKGSHILYYHAGLNEFLNIQPDGNKAKGYQVRQLRGIILTHGL